MACRQGARRRPAWKHARPRSADEGRPCSAYVVFESEAAAAAALAMNMAEVGLAGWRPRQPPPAAAGTPTHHDCPCLLLPGHISTISPPLQHDGLHLRVDRAAPPRPAAPPLGAKAGATATAAAATPGAEFDPARTLFIGNLPLEAQVHGAGAWGPGGWGLGGAGGPLLTPPGCLPAGPPAPAAGAAAPAACSPITPSPFDPAQSHVRRRRT